MIKKLLFICVLSLVTVNSYADDWDNDQDDAQSLLTKSTASAWIGISSVILSYRGAEHLCGYFKRRPAGKINSNDVGAIALACTVGPAMAYTFYKTMGYSLNNLKKLVYGYEQPKKYKGSYQKY